MTDKPTEQDLYEHWLAERRKVSPPANLSDQVMNQLVELERRRHELWWLRLIEQIERRRAVRWAVCCGALVIGALPYLFLAYVPSF